MSGNRLPSSRTDLKSGPRHDDLALRWESATGEGRVLARGAEALALYQSDMAEGFRGVSGGFMALGRIQEDGTFRTLIRQAIPLDVTITELVVLKTDFVALEDDAMVREDGAMVVLADESIPEVGLLALVIDSTVVEQAAPGVELRA